MMKKALKTLLIGVLLLSLLSGIALAEVDVPGHVDGKMTAVSVRHQGATGNGYSDDTEAFRRAVAAAKELGVPVFVPGGAYRLSGTVELDGVDLIGDPNAAWPADADCLPNILMTNPDEPLFILSESMIAGLKITVQSTTSNRNSFKECLQVKGNNVTIKNMKMDKVTTGIKTYGTGITGLVVDNVFMPTTQKLGVYVAGTKGRTVLKNIEMWTPTQNSSDFASSGIGMQLRNNEDLYMEGCFVFNASKGYVFEEAFETGNKAVLDNCTVDLTGIGVIVNGTHDLTFTGGTYWTHSTAIAIENGNSTVKVYGTELRSNGDASLKVASCEELLVQGTIIRRSMDTRSVSAVRLNNAKNVTIDGCLVYCNMSGTTNAIDWATPTNLTLTNTIVNTNAVGYPAETPAGCTVRDNLVAPFTSPT